ncbi:MAG: insertase, partial [Lactobacillus iners]|nr:insertase [Lactobacillus iners]
MKKIKYTITSALIAIIAIITTACATNTGNWTPP